MGKEAEDKSGQAGPAKPSGRFVRYGLVVLLTGAAALAWLSMLSFSPTDAPSTITYPPPPVQNVAGAAGAHVAYALLYWLGDGSYVLMLFATISAGILLLGGRIPDWPWRLVGLGLMVAVMSASSYLIDPVGPRGLLAGNILGAGAGEFLLRAFSRTGSWVVLLAAFVVALMFTADNLVLRLPSLGRKVWQRRGTPTWPRGLLAGRRAPARAELRNVPSVPRAAAAAPPSRTAEAKEPPPPASKSILVQPPAMLPITRDRPAPTKPGLEKTGRYELPSLEILAEPAGGYLETQEAVVLQKRAVLQQTLDDFGVEAQVVGHMTGPVISMFELSLAPGVKVSQIHTLAADMARALAVPGVRVVSPLPGRDTVGIEVPNLDKEIVRLKELMSLAPDAEGAMQIPLYLGKDASGGPIVADLAAMPHLLLAGTTGSGKSVCINSIICALLMTRRPEDVRLILIDPKMVEMAAFEKIPHLLCPIVNDMRRAEDILDWAASKMDERYELLKAAGVRNIVGYNRLKPEDIYRRFGAETDEEKSQILTRMTYYVIIIDELADLIMTSSKEVEGYIIRIAQKARAVGIHLILATQRPSVNVVTGLIKSNMPCRISFRVASRQESRIVLDQNGADVLLGQGDMLFLQPGTSHLSRAQGTFVDEHEVRALVEHVRAGGEQQFDAELVKLQSGGADISGEKDELFDKAVEIVLATERGSVSLLQRRLAIGYSRASRIVDQMAEAGILGDYKGSQAREVMVTLEDWQALKASIQADQSGDSSADGEPTSA